jgi:DNA-binding transcriptional LysR family regulator
MLNTIHLRTFLAVVENGNYSTAAEQLHMSQPAVSQHIKALEEQLEVRLFRRSGQQMVPTHAGEALSTSAREILALSQRAEENVRALRGQVSGQLTIGCTPSSGEQLLPPLLLAFRKRFPAISVAVTLAPLDTLLEWLSSQRVHMVIADESQRRRGWETQSLGSEPLALLAPRGHAILQHEQVTPAMLRNQSFVLPRVGSALRRLIEEGLRRRGVSAAEILVALETDGSALMIRAVRDGLGLAFLPQSRIPRGREIGVVNLHGLNLQQEWFVVRSRERGAPRPVQEFFTYVTGQDGRVVLGKEGLKLSNE